MSEHTHIEWCDCTFNPWIGCTKVSPGCAHCYAEMNISAKMRGIKWGKGRERVRTSKGLWNNVRRWNRAEERVRATPEGAGKKRPRVFCASLADWLDDEVPIEWLADLLQLIHETPNLDWLLLTKRPENFVGRLAAVIGADVKTGRAGGPFTSWIQGWLTPAYPAMIPQNVWFGVSVEDQKRAEERVPALLKVPARVRFLSCEPLLGPVDLGLVENGAESEEEKSWAKPTEAGCEIHWVIVGGESGHGARECHIDWIRQVIGQCKTAGVACFVKQVGSEPRFNNDEPPFTPYCPEGQFRHAKGGDMDEWPPSLRVREFPKA